MSGNRVLLNLIDSVSGTEGSGSAVRGAQLCICEEGGRGAEGLEALAADDEAMRVEIVVETGRRLKSPAANITSEMRDARR